MLLEKQSLLLSVPWQGARSKFHYSLRYRSSLGISVSTEILSFSDAITVENLSNDAKAILEEVIVQLNLEKLIPCYKYGVTVSCLKVIRRLQKFGHLPLNSVFFRSYAEYGHFVGKPIFTH